MGEKKLVIIKSFETIPEIGGLTGPIRTPIWVEVDKLLDMVKRGIIVEEVNSYNRSLTVPLTKTNIFTDNFAPVFGELKPKIEEVKEEENVEIKEEETTTEAVVEEVKETTTETKNNNFKKNKKRHDGPSTSDFSVN